VPSSLVETRGKLRERCLPLAFAPDGSLTIRYVVKARTDPRGFVRGL